MADGSAVSRSTYASLYAAIGTTYGAGDGSTTFNLPDLRGRVAVGKNGGTFGTLGATGGAETHTLTIGQMPKHNHNNFNYVGGDAGAPYNLSYYAAANNNTGVQTTTMMDRGNDEPHNNLQPYLVTNYIVKT